ncbi:MAG: hypothetical protein JNN03_17465 [Rubrivivax sp.]|nr:hypothetical protein [Rubrivivax sp.]
MNARQSDRSSLPAPGFAASARVAPGLQWLCRTGTFSLMLCGLAGVAVANNGPASAGGIYTCTNDQGRKLTSDRPIGECLHKEQLLLNRDGSVRSVIPPTYTAEERAEREARERRAAELRAAQQDAIRRDRNLMARYPTEEAHAKARELAMEPLRLAIAATERRLKELAAERVPLVNEAEFYQGKALPQKIKQQLDANDAAVEAQKGAAANQTVELDRVNKIYDAELDRLRRLWSGATPGSLGPMPVVAPGLPAKPVSANRPARPASAASR